MTLVYYSQIQIGMAHFFLSILVFSQASYCIAGSLDEEVILHTDIKYSHAENLELMLNLSRPTQNSDTPYPAVVLLHPGGWVAGDRSLLNDLALEFARRGYVAASVGYRLVPEATFPAPVSDAKCAVRYLRANANSLNIDVNRIGAVGFSAGAHLALMLATTTKEDGFDGDAGWADQSSQVEAVVAFAGPVDLETDEYTSETKYLINLFLAGVDGYVASPIHYLSKDDPPILLFGGTLDSIIPASQWSRFAHKMQLVGAIGRVELIEGVGHGFDEATFKRTCESMFDFIEVHLKPELPR